MVQVMKRYPPRRKKKKISYEKRRRRRIALVTVLSVFLVALIGGTIAFVQMLDIDSWRSFDPDKLVNLQQTSWLYDMNDAQVVSVHGAENRTKILINTLPKTVPQAFVAAEDQRFYSHSGIDIQRIFGALWADIRSGSLDQGASTITQQLIKLTHLSAEKTWSRKLQEAVLAFQLENNYSKDAILEMYLNVVYFGRGAYGIEAAAQSYFGIPAADLDVEQAACLAAILKAPSYYAPHLDAVANKERRDMILDNMAEQGYISAQDTSDYKAQPVSIIEAQETADEFPHGWFMDQAITEAEKILGISGEEFLSGGYRIYTTMDEAAQATAEEIYEDGDLFPRDARDGTSPESAMVVLDSKTGEVAGCVRGFWPPFP